MESSFDKIKKNFWSSFVPWVVKAVIIFFLIGMVLYIGSQYEQMFDGSTF